MTKAGFGRKKEDLDFLLIGQSNFWAWVKGVASLKRRGLLLSLLGL